MERFAQTALQGRAEKMTAEAAAVVRRVRIGRYWLTITVPKLRRGEVRHSVCEWEPRVPASLTETERRIYQRAVLAATIEAAGKGE